MCAGWGPEVFSAYSHWWLIPLIASHLGAILGAGLHLLLGNTESLQRMIFFKTTFIPPEMKCCTSWKLFSVGLHWPSDPSESTACGDTQEDQQAESLAKPGRGSNFLNVSSTVRQLQQCSTFQYSNLYHQNEISQNGGEKSEKKGRKAAHSAREEVHYSVVDKSKKNRNRLRYVTCISRLANLLVILEHSVSLRWNT